MSTLRPTPFSVDIELNFRVDLLNFDLNNSTHLKFLFLKNSEKIELRTYEKRRLSIYPAWLKMLYMYISEFQGKVKAYLFRHGRI
jgi:hypothetical protein